ncbi:protein FAM200B-like [Aphis craccivora]|uniref:Protein FAM200B-like n=1 Tax=Aphis craccivora TaxID=307492 RepID=A0A6G0W581_APHCR|nr:protein FAM200B-like [Aphis craccivora]
MHCFKVLNTVQLHNINVDDPNNFLQNDRVFLGTECEEYINNSNSAVVTEIKNKSLTDGAEINFKTKDVEEFWHQISKLENYSELFMYKNRTDLAKLCLCLPHSNAEAERMFSIVTDVKTKKLTREHLRLHNVKTGITINSTTNPSTMI